MRSYLIVANQTLAGPHLVSEARARAANGPSRFHLLVPARHDAARANWTEGEIHAHVQKRLDEALERFRRAGLEATGEIGDESPVLAVGDVLRRETFDEVIVSTLPPGTSRWLKLDLPHRIARTHKVAVTHLVAPSELVS
jgi:hypothetical protein